MYCCTVNEYPNNLQEKVIGKSFLNGTVTHPGCQLPHPSAFPLRGPGDFWKIPVSGGASHEASVGGQADEGVRAHFCAEL